ncbi:ABC transporter permease [Limnothrix redekei]|uniref:Transport permease protein n=1 Tax=Limnothrix redekei LRLZ20PSL1 TaxID=3112953 RepID=A0ABW7CH69_9CYAN
MSLLSGQQVKQLGLLRALVVRDLEAKYKGSSLGNLWTIAHQISQIFIYTYVFSIVLKVKLNLVGVDSNSFTFGLWLYAGLLPWTAITNALVQASTVVLTQPNLVKKVVFPLGLLPLVPVLSAFMESFAGFLLLVVMLGVSHQELQLTLILMPLIWIPQLLLTIGLSYLVAGLTVFIRDLAQSLLVVLSMLFYLTPIVYPLSAVPAEWRDWLLWLNPAAVVVEIYRELAIVGQITHWGEWLATVGYSLAAYGVGRWVYRRLRPGFADVL